MQVGYYGVHWAPEKIAFLHQERGSSNAIGTRESSPFVVRTSRRWMCNHLISLNAFNAARNHLFKFEELLSKNDLIRFMLPLPKDTGATSSVFTSKNHEKDLLLVTLLLKMSSPIKLPIFWADTANKNTLVSELGMTNVQPLVLAGAGVEHVSLVRDLFREALTAPRRLLVMAYPDLPIAGEVQGDHFYEQDEVDVTALPWETLGGMVLRAYMRSEWDGNWFSREPIPGNERKTTLTRPAVPGRP